MRLTLPALPRETMQRLLDFIRQDIVADRVQMDVPTQNLENYFLNVVENARAAQTQTSGASSGNRVAEYLRGANDAINASDKFLQRLTEAPPKKQPPTAVAVAETPRTDEAKLTALVAPPPATPAPKTAPPVASNDDAKINEKLSSLLGKKK